MRPIHGEQVEKKKRNYKLIIDPALKKGPEKVYRYDGVVPGVSIIVFYFLYSLLSCKDAYFSLTDDLLTYFSCI